jgi:hypothetical protein
VLLFKLEKAEREEVVELLLLVAVVVAQLMQAVAVFQ